MHVNLPKIISANSSLKLLVVTIGGGNTNSLRWRNKKQELGNSLWVHQPLDQLMEYIQSLAGLEQHDHRWNDYPPQYALFKHKKMYHMQVLWDSHYLLRA